MGRALVAALVQALEALRRDDGLRLVVLTGPSGGSFQGGVNVEEMASLDADSARPSPPTSARSRPTSSSPGSWRPR
jgi:enoyl-CoA hydratase/carnithine racemase